MAAASKTASKATSSPTKKKKTPPKASQSAASTLSCSSSTEKLIDSHVSAVQALKAFKALQAHRKKYKLKQAEKSKEIGKSQLPLDATDEDNDVAVGAARTEDTVYLNVTVKRIDKNKKAKPVTIPLPHPVHDATTSNVCLFVKDPQREYKDLLPTLGVNCVHRIIGVSKLKGKFAPFEARRQLLDEYDIFLCDERVGPLMPKLLGSKWQQRKKMPISVNLVRTKHINRELEKAVTASRFFANMGTTMSLPMGSVSRMTADDLVENLETALPLVIKRVSQDGWSNVQNVEVKTGKSASLPIWSSDLKDRWVDVADKSESEELGDKKNGSAVPVKLSHKNSAKTETKEKQVFESFPKATQSKKRSGAVSTDAVQTQSKKAKASKSA